MIKPTLEKIIEFQKALKNYQMSSDSRAQLLDLKLALFISVTSAGRNTIMHELEKTGKYSVIVSDTTRPMRKKDSKVIETNGVEYWFRSEDEILADIKSGKFIEAEVIHKQQVSGISVRELVKAKKRGLIAVNDVDFGGVNFIHEVKPDAILIMVLPPKPDEWMRRLENRQDITEEELTNRLQTAKTILEDALINKNYKLVINDKLESAVLDVRRIIEDDNYLQEDVDKGIKVTKELLSWVETRLGK